MYKVWTIQVLFATVFLFADARIKPIKLPKGLINCFERYSKNTYTMAYPAEQQILTCLQRFMWKESAFTRPCRRMTPSEVGYLKGLYRKCSNRRVKRQTAPKRTRKEYRALTAEERKIYHDAVRSLRNSGRYETIARYHQANAGGSAHNGQNFPGWHRLFLLIYEEALIEASNGRLKGLPYIDWRLDYRLSYAPDSILWTSGYLGTGNGQVTDGPFANWRIGRTTLVRNVGMLPYPTEESDVRNLYTIDSLRTFANELENVHNLGHIYIGGLMNDLSTATFDPTFFMHHCWVDYLWWRYQCPGGNCISSRFQYPGTAADGLHAPERNMDNLIYEGTLKNKDGYDQRWLQSVEYENSPADCRNNCNSRYNTAGLYCTSSRCISAGTANSLSGKKRRKRSPRRFRRSRRKSSRRVRRHKRNTLSYPVQNVFRVDCESNTNLWGFLPVKVVHVRSEKQVYNSFTVQNGTVQSSTSYDFYDNQPEIRKIDQYTIPGHPKHFKHCKTDASGALRINVNSFGLNYQGNYDEYAIVDDRIPVSSAMTYVAVRRPTRRRSSMVYLTSFDSCGRYCTPECLVPRFNPPRYRPCTGAIQINRRYPRGYANTYDDAVLMYFKFQKPGGCPTPMEQNVPIVFFCKREENWIPAP